MTKKMNLLVEIYPGYLTSTEICLGGWTVSTVRGRGGSIRQLVNDVVPAITTRRKRWCATAAVVRVGKIL